MDNYLQDSQELIETAIEQEDVGLVSMAIETTISTTNRVVSDLVVRSSFIFVSENNQCFGSCLIIVHSEHCDYFMHACAIKSEIGFMQLNTCNLLCRVTLF